MALFVAGVSLNTTEGELREIFQQYGKIIEFEMKRNFAFITFEEKSEAEAAMTKL